ncbi:MAG: hypothetical protein Q4C56_09095 [Peptococcaceae bacterium]|nr:hypothetical protein [Peptococcaceae bacterium]
MAAKQLLRRIALCFFAVTLVLVVLPTAIQPTTVTLAMTIATACFFVIDILWTLAKERSFHGFVTALLMGSLLLMMASTVGTTFLASTNIVTTTIGEENALQGTGLDGYTLTMTDLNGRNLNDVAVDIVLTRPDEISIHDTITQNEPLVYDGIEVHPVSVDPLETVFLVQRDSCRHLMQVGGVLFLVSLCLMAIPAARKKEGEA